MERGTQQGLHDDTWYRLGSNLPGGMVGVWVALDDVDARNGPVVYAPGSHLDRRWVLNTDAENRRDQMAFPHSVAAHKDTQDMAYDWAQKHVFYSGIKLRRFHARAGDIGIWHESLLHGGSPIRDYNR